MSVKMICDSCGAEVEVSPCPAESVERWHRLDGGGATQPVHLCSWQCVRDYAAAIIADGEGGQSGKQDTGGGLGVAQMKQSERDTLWNEINRLERERDEARNIVARLMECDIPDHVGMQQVALEQGERAERAEKLLDEAHEQLEVAERKLKDLEAAARKLLAKLPDSWRESSYADDLWNLLEEPWQESAGVRGSRRREDNDAYQS